jgi:hypothetical protein
MTDKELLELAAKAAGIEGAWNHSCQFFMTSSGVMFNPLEYDDEALRLAVKLELDIDRSAVGWVTIHHIPSQRSFRSVSIHQDPYAATRRAIVRAAAEIGKGK